MLKPKPTWNSGGGHPFIEDLTVWKIQEAFHVNKDSTSTTSLLFFIQVFNIFIAENNKYNNQYLDSLDNDRHSWPPDKTVQNVHVFVTIIQMVHGIKDMSNDYWSTHGTVLYPILQKQNEGNFSNIRISILFQ